MQRLQKKEKRKGEKEKAEGRESPCPTWASAHPSQLAQQDSPPPSVVPSPSLFPRPGSEQGQVPAAPPRRRRGRIRPPRPASSIAPPTRPHPRPWFLRLSLLPQLHLVPHRNRAPPSPWLRHSRGHRPPRASPACLRDAPATSTLAMPRHRARGAPQATDRVICFLDGRRRSPSSPSTPLQLLTHSSAIVRAAR